MKLKNKQISLIGALASSIGVVVAIFIFFADDGSGQTSNGNFSPNVSGVDGDLTFNN